MTNLEKSRLKLVKDEFIGTLAFNCKTKKWNFRLHDGFNKIFIGSESCNGEYTIVVILESPHKYEFEKVSLNTNTNETIKSRPLNNEKSRSALIHILESITTTLYDKRKEYEIVLINAIQYQTSLGDNNLDVRNANWLKNWIDYNNDFINRVKTASPDLIINLCTQGTYKKKDCNYQDLDEEYLNRFGLTFMKSKNALFSVRKSFGK